MAREIAPREQAVLVRLEAAALELNDDDERCAHTWPSTSGTTAVASPRVRTVGPAAIPVAAVGASEEERRTPDSVDIGFGG